jgi:hypothetical protein
MEGEREEKRRFLNTFLGSFGMVCFPLFPPLDDVAYSFVFAVLLGFGSKPHCHTRRLCPSGKGDAERVLPEWKGKWRQ